MDTIAFLKTPSPISLTGNAINFKIAGAGAFTSAGAIYHGTLTKTANFQIDQNIILTWLNKSVTITAVGIPSFYYHIAQATGYMSDILASLLKHPDFIEDFTATIEGDVIHIVARKTGADYNLVKSGTLSISVGVITSGVNLVPANNYKIITKVESEGNIITEHALSADQDPTETFPQGWNAATSGIVEININDLLTKEIREHFTLIFAENVKHTLHNILKPFRIFAYEQTGIPAVKGGGIYSQIFYALQGKLESIRQGELNYLQKYFTDLLTESQMFLSFAPSEKLTDIYAPERLYFPFLNAGTYRLWVEESYTDNTIYSNYRDFVNASANSIYEFDVSYKSVRTNFDRKLKSYKVWLTNTANEAISEDRIFVIDYTYYNNARYFYFLNSLGVYECIRIIGSAVKNSSITKEFTNIPYDKRFTNLDRQEKQLSANSEYTYEMNSGYFQDKFWADYFQQFLISPDVYWLKKGTAYPVSIRTSKYKVSEDGEFNPSAPFVLIHQIHDDFTENFVSTQPISVGDFNFDFNSDFFIGTGQLYYNTEQSAWITKNNCSAGYNGTAVKYTVPANFYVSSISQAVADQLALDDITNNGQAYANIFGTCELAPADPFIASISAFTNPSEYGAADGSITITASGGLAPYHYDWQNFPNDVNQRNFLTAGIYRVNVFDSMGHSVLIEKTLTQPAQILYGSMLIQEYFLPGFDLIITYDDATTQTINDLSESPVQIRQGVVSASISGPLAYAIISNSIIGNRIISPGLPISVELAVNNVLKLIDN